MTEPEEIHERCASLEERMDAIEANIMEIRVERALHSDRLRKHVNSLFDGTAPPNGGRFDDPPIKADLDDP